MTVNGGANHLTIGHMPVNVGASHLTHLHYCQKTDGQMVSTYISSHMTDG